MTPDVLFMLAVAIIAAATCARVTADTSASRTGLGTYWQSATRYARSARED